MKETKFCVDCKHFSPGLNTIAVSERFSVPRVVQSNDVCKVSYRDPNDLVWGKTKTPHYTAESMRKLNTPCGPEANLFESKLSPTR